MKKTSVLTLIFLQSILVSLSANADVRIPLSPIPGHRAVLKCELNGDSGEVSLVIDVTGLVERPSLIANLTLRTPIGRETWKDPTYFRKVCEQRKAELRNRNEITGDVWVSERNQCASASTAVETQAITFSPLMPDGVQYYSFQAFGQRSYSEPGCMPDSL